MNKNLKNYREKNIEQIRSQDLMSLVPDNSCWNVLDAGARDGWFSILLAEKCYSVISLDLSKPSITHPKIKCVKGDIVDLNFPDDTFNLVFCSEVLEHIPSKNLAKACSELERVASEYIIIGVPYKQDLRVGRTKCLSCGKRNPPWGHVNTFDLEKIKGLFKHSKVQEVSFVGINKKHSNWLSSFLFDYAGNPYGTYSQEEFCIHCGKNLEPPSSRNLFQLVATKLGFYVESVTKLFCKDHPNWIHILFKK